jgi:hypothetical protein
MDWYKAPSNDHWPADVPEKLNRESVHDAQELALGLVRALECIG